MSAPAKIAVHSLADLKNTTDDFIPTHLHALRFRQVHDKTDVRLLLGYSAVLIAGVLFYFDWKLGWAATKAYTAPAVVVYFLLNAAFTYWVWGVEKGVVYEGEGKEGKITIRTTTKKHIPLYHLTATYTPASAPASPQTLELRAPFTRWFTADGYFVAKPFQQWLASEIPIIGKADPENVVEDIGRGSGNVNASGLPDAGSFGNVSAANAIEILEQLKMQGRATGSTGARAGEGRRRKA